MKGRHPCLPFHGPINHLQNSYQHSLLTECDIRNEFCQANHLKKEKNKVSRPMQCHGLHHKE